MSVVVLFEAEFVPGGRERYLALAQKLAERARFSVSVDVSQYVLFGFLAAGAFGTVAGGFLIDRFGRRNVIYWSIFGAASFALMLPWADFAATVFLVIAAAVEISSAFSAILVCALDLKPGKTGMVSGLFFGLSFGLGGIAAAAFGRCCTVFTQRSRA